MRTVHIGDSLTRYWRLDEYFPDALNKGGPGQTPAQILDRFVEDVITELPDAVVILAGTNAPYASSVPAVIEMAEIARGEDIAVVLCQIPPRNWEEEASNGTDFNLALVAAAKAARFRPPVDLFSPMRLSTGAQNPAMFVDGTHFSTRAYDMASGAVLRALRSVLAPPMHPAVRFALSMEA